MRIRYNGSAAYQEYSVTGTNALWQPNQASDVVGTRLTRLLATGLFMDDEVEAGESIVTAKTNPLTGGIEFNQLPAVQSQLIFDDVSAASANTVLLANALASSYPVDITKPGVVWVSDTLLVKSNGVLTTGKNTWIKQVAGTNKTLVRNYASTLAGQAITITYVSGRTASINLVGHGKNVGDAVVIQGVTGGDLKWNDVFKVHSVTDADNFAISLIDIPVGSPTGSPLLFSCDHNMTVDVNLDYNYSQNSSAAATPDRMAAVFNFVAGSSCKVRGRDTYKYVSQIGGAIDCDTLTTGESSSDLHKTYGPARDVRSSVRGSSKDDCASLQCKEPLAFAGYQLSKGPINNCSLQDLSVTQGDHVPSGAIVIYADDQYRHDGILIAGPGSAVSNERAGLSIKNGDTFSSTVGSIGRVKVKDLVLGAKAGQYAANVSAHVEVLVIDSVELLQSDAATQWFRQENTSVIKVLEFRNLNLDAVGYTGSTAYLFNLNGAVDSVVFRNCRAVGQVSPGNKARLCNIGTNGVKSIRVDGGYYEYLDQLFNIAASNTVTTNVEIGGGAVVKNCSGVIAAASNIKVVLAHAVFDTVPNGVVRPSGAGVLATVYGGDLTTFTAASAITCVSSATARPFGANLPVDIGATGITKAAGASCFNTGSGRGTVPQNRPVSCDGASWFNTTNLSHTF